MVRGEPPGQTAVATAEVFATKRVRGPVSDEVDALVERARRGDRVAFTQLFRQHRSIVAAIVYRMMGPTADLEDVVQEVFLQVHRSLPDFRGQAKFSTWLHRVAVNVVLMQRRRAKSRPSFANEEAAKHEADAGMWPDQDVARQRRIEAFHRLLDQLSDKKRTVFVLHEIEGMAPAEIAKVVECPVLTVRTRLFYARKELIELMKNEPALAALVEELEDGQASAEATGERRVADGDDDAPESGNRVSASAGSDD